jgi:4-amino-4-deoxy-L-arabinose transferase-like glycosyltransferase
MALEATAPQARRAFRGEIAALQLVVGLFLLFRLYFDLEGDLVGDEAYYWMWGQHLAWSYLDHPPLHAWLLWLVSKVLGWSLFSARALTWLTLGGILAIFADWSRRFAPENPALWFWRTVATYLASPLFFAMTAIAYNDHLLVFLCLLAIHCFAVYADGTERGLPGRRRWLYLAAVALGLATLTKYNGVFVGLGFLLCFLLSPGLRRELRTPHPWLAAGVALLLQAPVVYWNLTDGLASYRFHLLDRWGGGIGALHWQHPLNFALYSIATLSPFLLWPLLRMIMTPAAGLFERNARRLALSIFTVSTVTFLVVSVVLDAYFYWNIVAFVGLIPLLTRFMANRWLRTAHLVFGLALSGLATYNLAVLPLTGSIFGTNHGSAINFGWEQVAAHVEAAEAKEPTDIVGATRYSTTSQLGFALGIKNAVKLSPEHSQYDYWQASLPLGGKSALILVDESDDSPELAWLRAHFATLEQIDAFAVTRYGREIYSWRLFRGTDYRDAP